MGCQGEPTPHRKATPMQITTAARRITRTVNAAVRSPHDWVLYFDHEGHEIHRHEISAFACDVEAAHAITARHRVTQAEMQEMITPVDLPFDDPAFVEAFMGS